MEIIYKGISVKELTFVKYYLSNHLNKNPMAKNFNIKRNQASGKVSTPSKQAGVKNGMHPKDNTYLDEQDEDVIDQDELETDEEELEVEESDLDDNEMEEIDEEDDDLDTYDQDDPEDEDLNDTIGRRRGRRDAESDDF
jgi:hypothetical protein